MRLKLESPFKYLCCSFALEAHPDLVYVSRHIVQLSTKSFYCDLMSLTYHPFYGRSLHSYSLRKLILIKTHQRLRKQPFLSVFIGAVIMIRLFIGLQTHSLCLTHLTDQVIVQLLSSARRPTPDVSQHLGQGHSHRRIHLAGI